MLVDFLSIPEYKRLDRSASVSNTQQAFNQFAIRWLFLLVLIFVVPYEWSWYQRLADSRSFFWYLSTIAGYRPNFIELDSESGRWGLASYADWAIAFGIAAGGAGIWSLLTRFRILPAINLRVFYYWTTVLIRYRIALGLIAFGFLKVYPMQMPFPALSNLTTDFGDYNTYKIYWQHVGISTWYQITLGWVEVIGGILMFFRATVFLGALINAGVLFNIAHANFGYDGGVHVYSSFFVLFSLIILLPYLKDLWRIYVLGQDVPARKILPVFSPNAKRLMVVVKVAVVLLFTVGYGVLRYDVHYKQGYLKDPITPGLPGSKGVYEVSQFYLNGIERPYSTEDSIRWQTVLFEDWSTFVYRVNKPFSISLANGTPNEKDVERTYELAGIAGGKRFLYYTIDSVQHTISLYDKNKPRSRSRTERNAVAPTARKQKDEPSYIWHYEQPTANQLILHGKYDNNDSIRVVLNRTPYSFLIKK